MTQLTWVFPSALWLLLAVPLVWIAHRAARTNFNPRQRRLQAGLRSLLVALLAVALARPVISSGTSKESIVYAVDVSHSIGTQAIEDAARRIDEIESAIAPAHSRIVAFGAEARVVESTTVLRALAKADPAAPSAEGIDRAGSDLEAALDGARGELATGHVPRIVLFSDGRATSGDVRDAVARLAAAGIGVSVEPMAVRRLGDTWIASIRVPPRLTAGATWPVSLAIGSQRDVDAVVELRAAGAVVARRTMPIPRGGTVLTIDATVEQPGAAELDASLTVIGDPLAANDTMRRRVWIDPRVRVLYVEGAPRSARYLSAALTASGFEVEVRPPAAIPVTVADADIFDVIVLSDVKRDAISTAAMSAVADWVERGGGLLVAGGDAVFGEGPGGYRHTTLERLTPVTFERRDEPSVALVLVLDRSWSMAGASMDLSQQAAEAALDVMTTEQSLGILTFNDKWEWDVTLRNVGKHREEIRAKIGAIGPSGGTLIFPALEQAYLALRAVKARAKHVVLLSDGRSYPDDYEALVKKMAEARVTVSAIAVGPSADQELLRNIARWGKGRQHMVADARELPQIFVTEARDAPTAGFDERAFKAIVKRPAFLQDVDLGQLPPLGGVTSTVLKDSAIEVMSTADGDPLLAFWPVGLGRAAVFASDVKDRWGAQWVTWRGYGPFFTAVVRALERQRRPPLDLELLPDAARGTARAVRFIAEARDPQGGYRDLLRPVFRVTSGSNAPRDVRARQVGPGRYEGAVVADARQPLTVTVTDGTENAVAAQSRTILPDPAAEYRFMPADEDLLRAVASATGRAWRPASDALAAQPGERGTKRRPLWPPLVLAALGLWLVDLVFRRVRILE